MRYYVLYAIAGLTLVLVTTFITIPIYRECRAESHSRLYCAKLAFR